jgi:hypothetical protein
MPRLAPVFATVLVAGCSPGPGSDGVTDGGPQSEAESGSTHGEGSSSASSSGTTNTSSSSETSEGSSASTTVGDEATDGTGSASAGDDSSASSADSGTSESEGTGGGACPDAPPERGLKVRFRADTGVTDEGGVRAWHSLAEPSIEAAQDDGNRRPQVIDAALNGHPVIQLDGEDDVLGFPFPVTGLDHMSLAAVSRTWTYQPGSPNADCDFDDDGLTDVGRELNCSGTDQSLLCWNEGGGAFASTGIFYGVSQTEVTFRFGTGQQYRFYKTPFVLESPPEDRFNWNLAVMNGAERTFWLDGVVPSGRLDYRDPEVFELRTRSDLDSAGATHGDWPAALGSAEPNAWIGRGRFEPATSYWAGEVAEILIWDVALTDNEREQLQRYVECRYFPERG